MKIILVILSVFILANCSSSSKKEEGSQAEKTMSKKGSSQPKSQTELAQSMGPQVTSVNCQLSQDKRMVSLEKVGSGCQVVYKKFGKTKTLGRSKNSTKHCKKIMERVQANLSGAGFSCK